MVLFTSYLSQDKDEVISSFEVMATCTRLTMSASNDLLELNFRNGSF